MFVKRLLKSITGVAALVAGDVHAAWDLNMPVGVTPISETAYDVHMLMLYICTLIGIVVFGVMTWSIIHHRKSKGHEAAQFHHSTFAEIVWTIIPFFILVGFAIPATKGLIAMEDTSESELTVKITGYQWKWRYDYIEDDVTVYSNLALSSRAVMYDDPSKVENYLLEVDNDIVLPVGKKIRFILTSDDVIHAWWVPALGMKKDAVPGYVNEFWAYIKEPGTYRGQCAELCGKDHGFMPIVVIAKDDTGFKNWVAERTESQAVQALAATQAWSMGQLIAKGKDVYQSNCATCHQVNGMGVADTFPAIKDSQVATGEMRNHLEIVMRGRPGTAMAAFEGQLTDVEMAAVITYQRNAFGNQVGDFMQPAAVRSARNL